MPDEHFKPKEVPTKKEPTRDEILKSNSELSERCAEYSGKLAEIRNVLESGKGITAALEIFKAMDEKLKQEE